MLLTHTRDRKLDEILPLYKTEAKISGRQRSSDRAKFPPSHLPTQS